MTQRLNPSRSNSLTLPLAASLVLSLAGCDSGPETAEPETVQQQLHAHLPELIDSSFGAGDFLTTNESWVNLQASLSAFDAVTLGLPFAAEEEALAPVPATLEEDPSGQEIADLLVTHLFNQSNYQGNGNYSIPGSLVCPDLEVVDEQDPNSFNTIVDQECLDRLSLIEPLVHVQSGGDGLDFALLIGPSQIEPLTLELRSDRITLAADLAEVKLAAEHLAAASDSEPLDLPATMEGVIALTLRVYGQSDIGVEVAIRQELNIDGRSADGSPLTVKSAKADPLAALRLNSPAETLSAAIDLHRTQVAMPWSSFDEFSNATGSAQIDWQGLSATLELGNTNSQEAIVIRNIGFGDAQSTIKLDDVTLYAVDLNPNSGRRFDLSMQAAGLLGLPTFTFDQELDLQITTNLAPLADAGDDIASHLLSESYRVVIENGMQAVEGLSNSGLKAMGGSIEISAGSDASSIVVNDGQCLLASDVLEGEHLILGALEAGACPL